MSQDAGRPTDLRWLAFLLLAVVVMLVATTPEVGEVIGQPDIGTQIAKGQQILFGQHPWVDMENSVYGPAIFYLSAISQHLGGESPWVELVFIYAGYLTAYGLLFWTFIARGRRPSVLLAFALVALVALPRFHKYHIVLPQALFLFSLHRAACATGSRPAALWLAGGAVLAGAFRIDIGAYAALIAVLFLTFRHLNPSHGAARRGLPATLALFCGSGLLMASPWLLYLLLAGHPLEMLASTIDSSLAILQGLSKPLPAFESSRSPLAAPNALHILFWLFRLAPFGVLLWLAARRREPPKHAAYLGFAACFAILVYLQAGHRIDLSHIKQGLFSGLFVACLAIDGFLTEQRRTLWRQAVMVGGLACLAFLVPSLAPRSLRSPQAFSPDTWRQNLASWALARDEILATPKRRKRVAFLATTIQRVRQLATPEEPVLFLPNLAQAYYFAGRHFATRRGWWSPGSFRSRGSQERFIDSLADTRWIVDEPAFTYDRLPARNARAYADRVMEHIYSRYGILEAHGPYLLLGQVLSAREKAFPLAAQPLQAVAETAPLTTDCGPTGRRITHVNTLPVGEKRQLEMPAGAGLLLTTAECAAPQAADCAHLGLLGDSGAFLLVRGEQPVSAADLRPVSAADLRLVSAADLRPNDLIDTGPIPPHTYQLVYWPCDQTTVEDSLPQAIGSGIFVRLRPMERSAGGS